MLPKLTLILGGAASGKSAFAEDLVLNHSQQPYYIATAQAYDAEMQAKIDLHIARRGEKWTTLDAPMNLVPALDRVGLGDVLIDCATMWLSNQMLAEQDSQLAQSQLLETLQTCQGRVVIVSNEVGQGIVPNSTLGRSFREAQGRLNIALAAQAALVVQVVAGLPNVLKGHMP